MNATRERSIFQIAAPKKFVILRDAKRPEGLLLLFGRVCLSLLSSVPLRLWGASVVVPSQVYL